MSGKYVANFLRNYLIFVLKQYFDAALNYLGSLEQVNDNTFQFHLKTNVLNLSTSMPMKKIYRRDGVVVRASAL